MVKLGSHAACALADCGCEVLFDDLTRCLYATDASIYRVEPQAVAFPRNTVEMVAVLGAAAELGLKVTPRGAGTGLAGGALGEDLVVDLARYGRQLGPVDLERRVVRVGPGVVLDQLNKALAPYGLWFGPDVATASRATIGGMIANNSSGAHAPVYGTTVDHLETLEIVLADGTVAVVGDGTEGLNGLRRDIDRIVSLHADEIAANLPPGLSKRWPGYGLDDYLRSSSDLSRLVAGSEGTLAVITGAVVKVVPKPPERSLGVVFFASVVDAMQAAVELLDLEPAAIEHIDRILFDQTRGQAAFAPVRDMLELDHRPCEAMLLVEFFENGKERLAELERRRLGDRTLLLTSASDQEMVWSLRRAGLALVTGRPGRAKPTAGIEDVCVRPEVLPGYVAALSEILEPLGLEVSYYGHAASGELHVRPVIDLHTRHGVQQLRQVADEVSDLCQRFGGSLAGEHGVGIARTEYLERHLGGRLMAAERAVKNLFDPSDRLNPGKIVDSGRFKVDRDLRIDPVSELVLPVASMLGFVDKDLSFVANLEQCNGCGGCRKETPTMCPTFLATGDELMSTRGRAIVIRAALEGRFSARGWPLGEELDAALESCLSCKACARECPSGVDMVQLKAELIHARHELHGTPLIDRVIAAADRIGRIGSALPRLSNTLIEWRSIRRLTLGLLGVDADRPLPPFASQRFDHWFHRRRAEPLRTRRRVLLWDDTWVRYHEPGVGRAAVEVLEAAGLEVGLVEGRQCCGRPAFSRGLLAEARRLGEHNLGLLAGDDVAPLVFLEPSCYSMFVDEYRQLGLKGAEQVAERCHLFEPFVAELLRDDPGAIRFVDATGAKVVIHAHCHAKALSEVGHLEELAMHLPNVEVELLDSGCCGMAGAFGMMRSKRDLSKAVARPLVDLIGQLAPGTTVVASGTSCRQQVADLTDVRPVHMAELMAAALERSREPAVDDPRNME